jgi:hypothetical protein
VVAARSNGNPTKVPGTPTENTKNRRLPIPKRLKPLVLANTAGLLVAFGVFVQGAAAAGALIVATTTKQSMSPPAEEVLLLRLKENVDVAPPIFPLRVFRWPISKSCLPLKRYSVCVQYRMQLHAGPSEWRIGLEIQ